MPATTIRAIRATPVTVPLEAPLRHSNGAHWGRFVRTIVEVESSDGYVGLGEMGGGGEEATRAFAGLESYLRVHDVFRLEALRLAICNPTASLYNNRTQLHAAIEFACLDIIGQKLGVPVHALLGGKLRDTVEFESYLFFRYPDPSTGRGEVRTAEQLVAHARELKAKHGFRTHKHKGGVFAPAHELACCHAHAKAYHGERMRHDPNAAWSFGDAVAFGKPTESPASQSGSAPRTGPSTDASPPPPRVPDHELLRCIGRGSYGEVRLARSVLGTYRAVKIVHRRSFEQNESFDREFNGLQKFEPISPTHDGLIDILQVGQTDERLYYIMELADSGNAEVRMQNADGPASDAAFGPQPSYIPKTLRSDLTQRGWLPVEECLRIGLRLTSALAHLHQHGLVHRDVKPSNVIFVHGEAKLADVGLVWPTS